MVPIVTTPRLMAVGGGALAELPAMLRRLGLEPAARCNRPVYRELWHSRSGDSAARQRPDRLVGVL